MEHRSNFTLIDGFFILVLGILSVGFLKIIQPFAVDIFMAVIITNIAWPFFQWLKRIFSGKNALAAGITVALSILLLVIPVGGVIVLISSELVNGYKGLSAVVPDLLANIQGWRIEERIAEIPWLSQILPSFSAADITQRLSSWATTAVNFTLEIGQQSFSSLASVLIHTVLTLFLVFFLLLDGEVFLKRIRELLPMSNKETDTLARRTVNMTNATLISTLIIGGIEGLFGGIVFWVFGIQAAALWGVVMMVLSIVPMIGANTVIWPGGVYLIVTGRVFSGVAVILAGMIGFTITQNVLKPKLLGERSGVHPAIILLSTLGGILWLGIIGFIIGPVIAALFISIWGQFGKRYRDMLSTKNEDDEKESEFETEPPAESVGTVPEVSEDSDSPTEADPGEEPS